jgi:hypothetical protein
MVSVRKGRGAHSALPDVSCYNLLTAAAGVSNAEPPVSVGLTDEVASANVLAVARAVVPQASVPNG